MLPTLLLLSYLRSPAAAVPASLSISTYPVLFDRDTDTTLCHCSCRTTLTIATSCVLTVVACVYGAVHPNIRPPKASKRRQLWEKFVITFFMLFFSEVVIVWAFSQWLGARHILQRLTNPQASLPSESAKILRKWTLVHAHFLQMGGFGRADNKHVLYLDELIRLIEADRIKSSLLDIAAEDIEDHSKADWFAKSVAALQIVWFILQCIVRLAEGLVLTELEVVTFAFASLNVIIYVAWWHKPLNVQSMVYLEIEDSPEPESPQVPPGPIHFASSHDPTVDPLMRFWRSWVEVWCKQSNILGRATVIIVWFLRTILLVGAFAVMSIGNNLTILAGYTIIVRRGKQLQYWVSLPDVHHVHRFYYTPPNLKQLARNLLGGLIGSIYGALHFLAWNNTFPTHPSRIIWRASTVVLTLSPIPVALFGPHVVANAPRTLPGWLQVPLFLCIVSLIMSYIIARFSLIVEAFITLRHLPPEAFVDIEWVRLIPHY